MTVEKKTRKQRAAARREAKRGERRHGPRAGTEKFQVEGSDWIYRKPVLHSGKWRTRRRHKTTGRVEMITCTDCRTITEAKDYVRAKAQNEVLDAKRAEETGRVPSRRKLTLEDALGEWTATLEARERTLAGYRSDSNVYANALGADRLVGELTYGDLEGFFTKLKEKGRAARTHVYHARRLRLFLAWCLKHGYVKRNLMDDYDVPQLVKKRARKAAQGAGQVLTDDEMRALLEAARTPFMVTYPKGGRVTVDREGERSPPEWLYDFVLISLATALRVSNVVGSEHKPPLQWGDLDLDTGVLSLPEEVMKGDRPFRVPLHREVLAHLRRRVKSLERPPDDDEAVVPCARDLRKSFHSALYRAGLAEKPRNGKPGVFLGERADKKNPRPFRIHDLRHSAIQRWKLLLPAYSVAALAGHVEVTGLTTDNYGDDLGVEELRAQLDKVPPLLGSKKRTARRKNA